MAEVHIRDVKKSFGKTQVLHGISVDSQTPPLRTTLGNRRRQTIDKPQALGSDTAYIANLVASLCLRLLLGDAKGSELFPCSC